MGMGIGPGGSVRQLSPLAQPELQVERPESLKAPRRHGAKCHSALLGQALRPAGRRDSESEFCQLVACGGAVTVIQ